MAKPKRIHEVARKVDKTMLERMPKDFQKMHEKKKPAPKKGK